MSASPQPSETATAPAPAATPPRDAVLAEWLARVDAVKLWEHPNTPGGRLVGYLVGDRTLIVQHRKSGWEVYVPSTRANRTLPALNAAAAACGLADSCTAGLVPEAAE